MIINVPSLTSSTLDSGFQVGDILETTRTDLSDDWLECDGSEVSASEYPELAGVLPSVPLTSAAVNVVNTGIATYLLRMKYVNGYYIALAKGQIIYSTSLDGPWTTVSVSSYYIYDIIYANGYWVLYTGEGSGSKDYGYIYYSTALNGTWTMGLSAGKRIACDGKLFYYNNKFIAIIGNHYEHSTSIFTASTPSSWTAAGSFNGALMALDYSSKRKRWEMPLAMSYSSIAIAYSTNLLSWTVSDTCDISSYSTMISQTICPYLGIGEKYWNFSMGDSVVSFLPDGTFYKAFTPTKVGTGICIGNAELLCSTGYNQVRSDPESEFEQIDAVVNTYSSYSQYKLDNGEIYVCGNYSEVATGNMYGVHGIYLNFRPEITVPDANGLTKAYIKAK